MPVSYTHLMAIGVIMFVARVWDAVNDPMMGTIVDKTHSKDVYKRQERYGFSAFQVLNHAAAHKAKGCLLYTSRCV